MYKHTNKNINNEKNNILKFYDQSQTMIQLNTIFIRCNTHTKIKEDTLDARRSSSENIVSMIGPYKTT